MSVPFTRLFSTSAFEGLRSLYRQREFHPALPLAELTAIVTRVEADSAGLDFEAAFVLAGVVGDAAPVGEGVLFYQWCVVVVILSERPVWAKVMTLGRQKFAQKLARDEQQCFRAAGLLVDPPTPLVIGWWDRIVGHVRLAADQERLERARIAEKLTIEHEVRRLRELGIHREVKWIAIEDNTAAYDVLSFDQGSVEPTNRLIEVKSTVASPLRFQLTRHEWDNACRFGNAYHFHIWDLHAEPYRLYERSVAQVAPHVPEDRQRGRWRNVEIPVGSQSQ